MRTTVTLDQAVHDQIEAYARETHTSFRQAIDEVLRRGLSAPAPSAPERFRVQPHDGAFLPGIDPGRLNQLMDELEVEDFVIESRR